MTVSTDRSAAPFPLVRWILLCFAGWILGIVLILFLSGMLDSIGIEYMQFHTGMGVSAGISILQFFILRKRFGLSASWMSASMLGFTLPFFFMDTLRYFELIQLRAEYNLMLSILTGTVCISYLQFRLLDRKAEGARRWIMHSVFGWLGAGLLLFAVNYTKYISSSNLVLFLLNLLLILGGGIVVGIATGTALRGMRSKK